ncbi:MAG TPA: hypothetical protein VEK33_23055 [Terriglobales bacterium]|nr:hypothetical protein [Terriglobales bacterium]
MPELRDKRTLDALITSKYTLADDLSSVHVRAHHSILTAWSITNST